MQIFSLEKKLNMITVKIMGKKLFSHKCKNNITDNAPTEHAELIDSILRRCCYKSYLELGIYDAKNYNYIVTRNKQLDYAECVDMLKDAKIAFGTFFKMTTDNYFLQNKKKFDVIFIDACHDIENVIKDFENSVKILNSNGLILLHDTSPKEKFLFDKNYCSDAYKINDYLNKHQDYYNYVTLPISNCGITIVNKKHDLRHINL